MTEPMTIYRLEDLSIIYFVKNLFNQYEHITIVNEFPKTILKVPTVAIVNGKLIEENFELGNRVPELRTRRWFIDIYASTITQRDDFAYRILQAKNDGINVYDYNEGFPPDASPTKINHLSVIKNSYEPLSILPQINEVLYYRGQLILITQNDKV